MTRLKFSIEVMLSQLPPHTVAKKIENYEHLDLLWGTSVDKDVFPHVLDCLKTHVEQAETAKSQETSRIEETTSHPPAYTTNHDNVPRKAEASEPSPLFTAVVGIHLGVSENEMKKLHADAASEDHGDVENVK